MLEPDPGEELLDELDEAIAAGLIAERGHGEYAFTHALVRGRCTRTSRRRGARGCTAGWARRSRPAASATGARAPLRRGGRRRTGGKAADYAIAAGREAARRAAARAGRRSTTAAALQALGRAGRSRRAAARAAPAPAPDALRAAARARRESRRWLWWRAAALRPARRSRCRRARARRRDPGRRAGAGPLPAASAARAEDARAGDAAGRDAREHQRRAASAAGQGSRPARTRPRAPGSSPAVAATVQRRRGAPGRADPARRVRAVPGPAGREPTSAWPSLPTYRRRRAAGRRRTASVPRADRLRERPLRLLSHLAAGRQAAARRGTPLSRGVRRRRSTARGSGAARMTSRERGGTVARHVRRHPRIAALRICAWRCRRAAGASPSSRVVDRAGRRLPRDRRRASPTRHGCACAARATARSRSRPSSASCAASRWRCRQRSLLTFDDGRADVWTAADPVLARARVQRGAVRRRRPGRRARPRLPRWAQVARLQRSGRWDVQLESGSGKYPMRYGPGRDDIGPFYAYRGTEEVLGGWRERVFGDVSWGQRQLAFRVRGYRPLAFSPPYGNYGQRATNDTAIPRLLLERLHLTFTLVFTQDRPASPPAGPARAGRSGASTWITRRSTPRSRRSPRV